LTAPLPHANILTMLINTLPPYGRWLAEIPNGGSLA
jgi:hypothetical protein